MKLKLLFVLPLLCLASLGYSQQPVISATGGLNFGKWKLDEKSSFNHSRVGVLIGATVDLPVQEDLSIQTGLQYAMFGTHFKYSSDESIYKVNYLLIPVLADYHFKNGISVHAGPELGFLLSANSVLDGDHYDFKDEMKKLDVFIVLGVSYTLQNDLQLGFRLHGGLTNVENGASTSIHNRGISLLASYPIKNILK